MACTLAESPSDPIHRKLRQLRRLCCRFDCYRVERTSSRAGVAPAEVQRFSWRTISTTIQRNAACMSRCAGQVLPPRLLWNTNFHYLRDARAIRPQRNPQCAAASAAVRRTSVARHLCETSTNATGSVTPRFPPTAGSQGARKKRRCSAGQSRDNRVVLPLLHDR
jgi:hypothetical protein